MSATDQRVSADDSIGDEELTRYLFGEMSETEQMQLELRYFDDPQMFAELCAWRNNLIDQYVVGELSPSMRGRFEAAIENSWAMNERIRFAETFQETIDARSASAVVPRHITGPGSFRAFAANHRGSILAAGALLTMLGTGWVVIRIRHNQAPANNEEDGLQTSAPAPFAPDSGVNPSSASAQTSPTTATLASNPLLAVTLTPTVGRSVSDGTREIQIPQNTVIVHLLLIVNRPLDVGYRGILTTLEGARVFETGQVTAHANETGKAVELYVPASLLPDGDYFVRLSPVTADNKGAENYYFRIRKR
jgi:hypothetical protein